MAEVQVATVEINDAVFCTHLKEVVRVTGALTPHSITPHFDGLIYYLCLQCTECDYDGREENDAFYGVELIGLTFGTLRAYTCVLCLVRPH
jgi:hypothetical protein